MRISSELSVLNSGMKPAYLILTHKTRNSPKDSLCPSTDQRPNGYYLVRADKKSQEAKRSS
jgi:hypothetical protein